MAQVRPAECAASIAPPESLAQLLQQQASLFPDASALVAPGSSPLTYSRLYVQLGDVGQRLRSCGIHSNDRVALVLPNGPEAAVAFLTVAASATCVPLNPASSATEFAGALQALGPKALLLLAGSDSPARTVAQAQDIQLLEVQPQPAAPAGVFGFGRDDSLPTLTQEFAQPDDVALILQTSGTTSPPKSVLLTHRNLCTAAHAMCTALELRASDRCLNVLALHHVYGLVGTLLTSLTAGASVICTPGLDVTQFFAWMAAFRPTWYAGTPTVFQAILAHAACHQETLARCPLRFIRSGSAPLPLDLLVALEKAFQAPVIEAYGMTETSSQITCNPLPPRQRKPGSVGLPAGPEVAIMDHGGSVLPAGMAGEIVVRGGSVTQGYDHNPSANCQAFRHSWFRTGDAGYVDAEGYLFVVGRLHEMIQRGETTIPPWDVDRVLLAHPAVAQAVTFAIPDVKLGQEVAAAVVLHPQAVATASEIRQFAVACLPAGQVPSRVLLVEAIPQGANGKLQRASLAEKFGLLASPVAVGLVPFAGLVPPTPLVNRLKALWRQVLGVDHVETHDSFFQVGGDSLQATQLVSRLRESMGLEISLQRFFEMPTVAGLAGSIATGQVSSSWRAPAIHRAPRQSPIPLSYAQQRLWLIAQLGLSAHAYHLQRAIHLHGPLCVEALERSLQAIVERHEILRTTFGNAAGQLFQVLGTAIRSPLSPRDLGALPAPEREAQVERLAHEEIQQPFDLSQGPLIRATLLHLAEEDHVLLLTMHHIVSDGWSQDVFWQEFAVLYEAFAAGQASPLPPLACQYADYAHWQRQWLQGDALETLLSYWRQQLAGLPPLQLPTDHARPPVQSFRGARHSLTLSPELTQGLKALSQRHGTTLFMTLLAAFQTLLYRYTGQDDLAVGSLIANRNRIEVENLIGFFVNVLVLRTDFSGDPSFVELLKRVRRVALEAYEHQDLPFEKLLEDLRPPRDLSRNPLFEVLFVLHNTLQQPPQLPGLTVQSLEIDPGTARFDLAVEFWETPAGLRGRFEYSTALFEAATISRMGRHLQTLLEGIVAAPAQRLSQLPLLTADERHRMLVEWNNTASVYPADQCIHTLFQSQVAHTPDAVALVCGDESLTYHELNCRANRLARYLQACGVGRDGRVGLCLERSPAMVVGLLGILKAGAAYVPLDPSYPAQRLDFIVGDAQLPVILTQDRLTASLPTNAARIVCLDSQWPTIARYPDDNLRLEVSADQVAYLLYTSGSTGNPKGVLGVHHATINALAWMWQAFPFADDEICCQKTSISFGDSIQELLGPLLRGIPIILIPDDILKDLPRLAATLARHRVTRLILVPSLLQTLLESYADLAHRLPSLKLWFAGGEALPSDLWQRFREQLPEARLVNLYGASEASDDTTWYDTSLAPRILPSVPIGHPIANTQLYVLDQHLQPVPVGVPGELYVAGAGLTQGYFNHPELTAERFIPHHLGQAPGARLYKTGDLVRYQGDGSIEYLGRLDLQVKLRGVRIELEEIEAALRQHPAVRQAVVMVREDVPGDQRLVAYIVPAPASGPISSELHRFLEKRLPPAMVPSGFVMLERLPQTPSGKVDSRALPAPSAHRPALQDRYVAPRTAIEQQVAAIWCHVLGLQQVGLYDNFFDLGGHSLLAMRLLWRVRDAMGVEVALLHFLEAPTVARMTASITAAARSEPIPRLSVLVPIAREGALPASIAQEPFWFFDQLLPGLPLFNIPCVIRLTGEVRPQVLELSLLEIITRHEALRTTFAMVAGQLVQRIAAPVHMPLALNDLRTLPTSERLRDTQRLIQEESQHSFDLSHGPLLRGRLLHLGKQEHLLLLTLHHIIADGWSLRILLQELGALYEAFAAGNPSPLSALSVQYADFASWQRRWQHDAAMKAQLEYWKGQLRPPLPTLDLPTDRPRGAALHLDTASQPVEFSRELTARLKNQGQQEGSTVFMTWLAALKILLYGYTGQEDLCIATLVANRTRPQTEALIGLLANTVMLRTDLGGNPTGREVLQRVRATTVAAYAHQDFPFEELMRILVHERRLQRASFGRVMVIWQNFLLQPFQDTASSVRFEVMGPSIVSPNLALTTFDLVLILREGPDQVSGTCLYKTELFEASTISHMLDDFQSVLTGLAVRPEQAIQRFQGLHKARA